MAIDPIASLPFEKHRGISESTTHNRSQGLRCHSVLILDFESKLFHGRADITLKQVQDVEKKRKRKKKGNEFSSEARAIWVDGVTVCVGCLS